MGGVKRQDNPKELRGDLSLSFRSKSLKSINEFPLCAVMGRCGIPYFWNNRNGILYICQVATFLSIICTIFACLSIGVSPKLTKIGAWSSGTGEIQGSIPTAAWVGLSGAVWRSQTGDTWTDNYILWEDDECYADYDSQPYCDNCNSAGNSAVGLVMLAAVTRVPSVLLLQSRMLERADEPLFKFLGFISETLAFCCFSGATFVWREYCHKQLPFSYDMNYRFGGGFILVGLGLALSCCIAITHIAMPCEPVGAYKRRQRMAAAEQERARHLASRTRPNPLDTPQRKNGKQKQSRNSTSSLASPGTNITTGAPTGMKRESSPAIDFQTGERTDRHGSNPRKQRSKRTTDSGVTYQQESERLSTLYTTPPSRERDRGRPRHHYGGVDSSGEDKDSSDYERSRRGTTGSSRKKKRNAERDHSTPRSEPPIRASERGLLGDQIDFDGIGITLGGETMRREMTSP